MTSRKKGRGYSSFCYTITEAIGHNYWMEGVSKNPQIWVTSFIDRVRLITTTYKPLSK